MENPEDIIWLKKLRKVAEELRGTRRRTAEEGIAETVLLMTMAHNRLQEVNVPESLKQKIQIIQSAGSALRMKTDERR